MGIIRPSTEILQLRQIGLLPESLARVPTFPKDITLQTNAQLTFGHLMGVCNNSAYLIKATPEGSIRQASYGNDYRNLTSDTGSGASTYNATNQILRSSMTPKWDILIEAQDALIRFNLLDGTDSDDIVCPVGFRSVEFAAYGIQVKNRGASNCIWSITCYYE